ncbi:MAG: hypothetical protein KBC84_10310, partial [Proteobacteria bacterium]|nr:hypothetical protein [Pseudomonadota bacterium]
TIIRVTFFLMAAFPATVIFYSLTIPKNIMVIFTGTKLDFFTWLIAIFSSLGLITLISSIAELKHRHLFSGLIYKFLPLVLFLIGCVTWFLTVFINSEGSELVQKIITVLPIVGLTPIILSPLFKISYSYKVLHFLVCLPLIAFILRKNISWFAAHLDEV